MRVTTQMLNRSAQKAGLPTNRASLLNYINGSNSSVSPANALSKTDKAAAAVKKADYEKLEKAADGASAATDRLMAAGGEAVTASDMQSFVDKYNELLKSLGKSSDTLNLFYAQTARDTVKEYKQELAELGVTVAKDGTLSLDKARFEKFRAEQAARAASAGSTAAEQAGAGTAQDTKAAEKSETAENTTYELATLFAREGGLFSKLSFLASQVSDYADANAESYSDYYNAAGSRANAYSNGKYSFWS